MKEKYLEETIKFLELISNSVGEIITEYHWREAMLLITCIKEREKYDNKE